MSGVDNHTFFMGYTRVRPDVLVPYIEEQDVPTLNNAHQRWSEHTDRFLPMWDYDAPRIIDAGGYNVMASYVTRGGNLKSGKSESDVMAEHDDTDRTPFYPWTMREYHDWLMEWSDNFIWASAMDYACEDRFETLWSVSARVEATWENTVRQCNMMQDDDADYTLLPVLQGRSVDDYVGFYERLEDHGLPTDYVGIGTICRLSEETAIADVEVGVRERCGPVKLHGFGAKISAFRHGATFDTADSQAWSTYPSSGEMVVKQDGKLQRVMMDKTRLSLERTTTSFKEYYDHASDLLRAAHRDDAEKRKQSTVAEATTALR